VKLQTRTPNKNWKEKTQNKKEREPQGRGTRTAKTKQSLNHEKSKLEATQCFERKREIGNRNSERRRE
jgi:hypothetical protein